MLIQDYVAKGLTSVRNDMGEIRTTNVDDGYISIIFPNGWVSSIVIDPQTEKAKYSVAVCDYEGYFDWNVLRPFGTDKGTILCNSEEEVCKALDIIISLK